ncbi:quinone-dependent dihydroorotate dehydrogenase [Sphingomonas abietis]|uniref:Dihydroorotate dehydrogenase (quinone) n=1 Tax=Sphingomonas abietis TaxID=3012344 RepID=A0ABY7NM42_9SPHN|nr:quinone-dependent dihydroorotate dehydrogenase [Sphingomonas abietis]WBO22617.1 quinone-dependent dihydroorotate dehydrogenase [Sphingomonas abietis]
MLYPFIRPLIFRLDAERAHHWSLAALERFPRRSPPAADPRLAVRIAGLDFPNPVGLAAGYDKDARVPDAMLGLGFGFVEVGTLTPQPQAGNPQPRLFRLVEDQAVINRMGFNNGGQEAAFARLAARARTGQRGGIVGVNVGANKDATDRIADYAAGVRAMAPVADYLTINISSPNTPGLRALQEAAALDELLAGAIEARGEGGPPIFLKVAPDLEPNDIHAIARVVIDRKVDALIVANTTVSRPPLSSGLAGEQGGLSGEPLRPLALQRLRDFRHATGGRVPLIAAGGIASAADAYARIRAGASLIQLYSALVYEGPGLAKRIASGLVPLLERDGFGSIAEAIGA